MAMNEITTSHAKHGDRASTAASNPDAFQMPAIEMPADAVMNEKGYVVFQLDTTEGPIVVQAFLRTLDCRGTAAALIAGGFCRPEWLPGLPGNNKSRQMVCFGPHGHWLQRDRHPGKKQPWPSITVARVSGRTFGVEVPATPEQVRRLEDFHDQYKWVLGEQVAQRKKNERIAARKVMPPEVAHQFICGVVDSAIDWIHSNMEGIACAYTPASDKRIDLALEELRRAFTDGCVVQAVPKYHRDGNLIQFPRRSPI